MGEGLMLPPPAPPTVTSMLAWDPPPIPLLPAVALLLAASYGAGVWVLHRRGVSWPWPRTVSFLTGSALLAAITGLAIESYGFRLFSAFMFQHLTLSILIPPLLVLGSPGRLLLRATPHHGLGRLVLIAALAGLRSPIARFLLHPGFTIPLFLFSYYGLYLSNLFDVLAASWVGHTMLEVLFLAAGLLFIIPILSPDPLPVRQSNLGKLLDIFVEMPLHVFIGVILMMAPTPLVATFADPPANWGVDPVADQGMAGALAWSYGEPVALITIIVFAWRWRRDEQAATESEDDRADADLAAYNAYLKQLHTSARTTPLPGDSRSAAPTPHRRS